MAKMQHAQVQQPVPQPQ
jgi:hypothetical protein